MEHTLIYLACLGFGAIRTDSTLAGFVRGLAAHNIEAGNLVQVSTKNSETVTDSSYVLVDGAFVQNVVVPVVLCGAFLTWNCIFTFVVMSVLVAVAAFMKVFVTESTMVAMNVSNPRVAGEIAEYIARNGKPEQVSVVAGVVNKLDGALKSADGIVKKLDGALRKSSAGATKSPAGATKAFEVVTKTPDGTAKPPVGVLKAPDSVTTAPVDVIQTPIGTAGAPEGFDTAPSKNVPRRTFPGELVVQTGSGNDADAMKKPSASHYIREKLFKEKPVVGPVSSAIFYNTCLQVENLAMVSVLAMCCTTTFCAASFVYIWAFKKNATKNGVIVSSKDGRTFIRVGYVLTGVRTMLIMVLGVHAAVLLMPGLSN